VQHRPAVRGQIVAGPVGRESDQLRALEREAAGQLGKLDVVADPEPDPAVARVHDRRGQVSRREPQRLAVPQVELAVHGDDAAPVDERRAVVQPAVGTELGEPADHDRVTARGLLRPASEQLSVGRGRGGARLVDRLEHVPAVRQFGHDDDLRAGVHGCADRLAHAPEIPRRTLDVRCQLAACDPNGHVRK
jgi:hypothetical protein